MLGASGCGKTTLLRLLAGFEQPDGGSILFNEADVSNVPVHERHIGMVFQSYALWPHMNVRENLEFGLKMQKLAASTRRTRIHEVLSLARMNEYSERYPHELSGGQQQRVALARALVLEPRLVLLDEPLSNLDARLRGEIRDEMWDPLESTCRHASLSIL